MKRPEHLILATIYGKSLDEDGLLVIGFAESDDFTNAINLQFSEQLDDQDIAHGWTRYYLDTTWAGGAYSCLASVTCTKNEILLVLNQHGKLRFEVDSIRISMLMDHTEIVDALASLQLIFLNEPGITFISA